MSGDTISNVLTRKLGMSKSALAPFKSPVATSDNNASNLMLLTPTRRTLGLSKRSFRSPVIPTSTKTEIKASSNATKSKKKEADSSQSNDCKVLIKEHAEPVNKLDIQTVNKNSKREHNEINKTDSTHKDNLEALLTDPILTTKKSSDATKSSKKSKISKKEPKSKSVKALYKEDPVCEDLNNPTTNESVSLNENSDLKTITSIIKDRKVGKRILMLSDSSSEDISLSAFVSNKLLAKNETELATKIVQSQSNKSIKNKLSLKNSMKSNHDEDDDQDFTIKPRKVRRILSNESNSQKSNISECRVELEKLKTEMLINNNKSANLELNDLKRKLYQMEATIKAKELQLEKLKQHKVYKTKHDVAKLENITHIWKVGCQTALRDLLVKLKEFGTINMEELLQKFNIPSTIFVYNSESDSFT